MNDKVENNEAGKQANEIAAPVEHLVSFKQSDVIAVAKDLLEDAVYWDEGRINAMDARDGYACRYCGASEYQDRDKLKHDTYCSVLIANDLLTGS